MHYFYIRFPHSYLENQITYFIQYATSKNYEKLVQFGCIVGVYNQAKKRKKMENFTKRGIMLGYSRTSTELCVLCFESANTTIALSASAYSPKDFPAVSEDTRRPFVLKIICKLSVENDDYVIVAIHFENTWENAEPNKTFLTSSEATSNSMNKESTVKMQSNG